MQPHPVHYVSLLLHLPSPAMSQACSFSCLCQEWMEDRLGLGGPRVKIQLCRFLTVGLWASYLTSWDPSFVIHKMGLREMCGFLSNVG